ATAAALSAERGVADGDAAGRRARLGAAPVDVAALDRDVRGVLRCRVEGDRAVRPVREDVARRLGLESGDDPVVERAEGVARHYVTDRDSGGRDAVLLDDARRLDAEVPVAWVLHRV